MSEKSPSGSSPGTETLCSIRGCSRKRKYVRSGYCQTHYHREYRTGTTELIDKPLRDDVTYRSAHTRNERLWGTADNYPCIECGDTAKEWAYDGTDPSERTERVKVNGEYYPVRYSVWPEFYAPLCFSCHRKNDRSAWAARRTHCKAGHELTEENTYTRPSRPGTKECKVCRAENSKERYRKRKAIK